jgi:hypothetical protein
LLNWSMSFWTSADAAIGTAFAVSGLIKGIGAGFAFDLSSAAEATAKPATAKAPARIRRLKVVFMRFGEFLMSTQAILFAADVPRGAPDSFSLISND